MIGFVKIYLIVVRDCTRVYEWMHALRITVPTLHPRAGPERRPLPVDAER